MPKSVRDSQTDYDAVVVGGAIAGAASALLLRRSVPGARVLIVELLDRFPGKVGEATVEVSGFFLQRVLGLDTILTEEHLAKHGLRYWFSIRDDCRLGQMTEVGPTRPPDLPSFQLDRARLDTSVLQLAVEEGCELARPARVTAVEQGWPRTRVTIDDGTGTRTVSTRWLIDASGRSAFLARRKGLLERTTEHPTAATWARWSGVADMDEDPWVGPGEGQLPPIEALRRHATNHFCGYGWWCWVIPLSSGRTSVGIVYDKRLFALPGSGSLKDRYRSFVQSQPGLRELLAQAEMHDDDCLSYSQIPYRSRCYAGRGWALVGDAAAFMDPYYSPGLDHVSMSAYATSRLVGADLRSELSTEQLDERLDVHNQEFARSYRRWISALYIGKYKLLGDADLTASAFMVETALYYLGVVGPIYKASDTLRHPVFGQSLPQARLAYRLALAFSSRLQRLAELRRRSGLYGRGNEGRRLMIRGFNLGAGALPPLLEGIRIWLRLEVEQILAWRPGRAHADVPTKA